MTKNANIRCINFNEPDLITCFSNDFGYDNWLSNSIKFYGDKGDILIAISSSGKSKNIINGCAAAKKKKFSKIITLTGHSINNPVMKKGDINLWINSKAYNFIENIHQFWLLLLVDLVIGKTEYLSSTKLMKDEKNFYYWRRRICWFMFSARTFKKRIFCNSL